MNLDYIHKLENTLGLKFDVENVPAHVAIVMDGNGRWAKSRGLNRSAGHRAGVVALENIIEGCQQMGVKYVTVYAFSTENWKRPLDEVATLMSLLVEFVNSKLGRLQENGVRVEVVGDLDGLPTLQKIALKKLIDDTAKNSGLVLNLALNYGGRAEILAAAKKVATLDKDQLDALTEDDFGKFLNTGDQPDPDFLIRTSGELRLSNFLLWQLAYAEFYFTDVYWPDFGAEELFKALCEYQQRKRRFGDVK